MQKQIVLNEDYQNQLKLEIEQQSPFVSDLLQLNVIKFEYRDNFKFGECFEELSKRYTRVRRLRRDGNCFYRAYLFQVFEHFIQATGTKENPVQDKAYEEFLAIVEKSKGELVGIGYDEIVVEDFYDIFLEETKKLKEIDPTKA